MKPWSAFFPDVMPELPGAPDILVEHRLRNVAIDFCERSKAHIVNLDAEDSVIGEGEYDLASPSGTEIVEVLSVSYANTPLTPKSSDYLDDKYGGRWDEQQGTPEHYTQVSLDKLILIPAPANAESGVIHIKVALKPALTAAGIDDLLFKQYRLAIAAGLKAEMMAMAGGAAWANPDFVAINAAKFESAIADAKHRVKRALVRAVPRFNGRFM